jgi:hypothetical protein
MDYSPCHCRAVERTHNMTAELFNTKRLTFTKLVSTLKQRSYYTSLYHNQQLCKARQSAINKLDPSLIQHESCFRFCISIALI